MCNLQESAHNSNPDRFTGAVGKGPARQTKFGMSIDVVRTDNGERVWGDLVPTNQEVLEHLVCGTCFEVTDVEVIKDGYRPLWRGKVAIIVA